ncbi:GntR family transcriptional regulator [Lapidilactobacillus bayanensis]|uniref:GntR family transcriptional regulator n=1 Tax=Lapidilactobacillus bayanensis TaxID=2485998 RepID=UPI000F76D3F6|nr:GntR family transcriptional regulator [Lapidilactobacillus bayanensis]
MKKRDFIVQDLISKIYQRQFASGKLPDQRKLAKVYHVSRYTIQAAVKLLQEMGVVKTVQGSGIFVANDIEKNQLIFNSLTRTPYERITSKMLSLDLAPSTPEEARIFQIPKQELIWTFQRIRIVNYKIEQIETSKMPYNLFPQLSQAEVEGSIQAFVEETGLRISHSITSYSPTVLTRQEEKIFQCKHGQPAMNITTRSFAETGEVYEYTQISAIDYTVTYITPFDREQYLLRKKSQRQEADRD